MEPFFIYPFLGVGVGYNDNLTGVPNDRISSTFLVVSPRVRADDAVHGEMPVALEAQDRAPRSGPGVSVDRPAVEPVRLQRDLECRHAGAPRRIGPGCESQGRGEDEQTEERPERHGILRFGTNTPFPRGSGRANARTEPSQGQSERDQRQRENGSV